MTGAAGFIGSSLVDRLLDVGHEVIGIDCLTPYYDQKIKQSNLFKAFDSNNFALHTIDLSEDKLDKYLDGITHIFHQAGQPGVRASWGNDFNDYVSWNVIATQRLLESALASRSLVSFVAASSSSVYGSAETFPTNESQMPSPISPYGVSKLAAENLVTLYGTQFGLPTVNLRYFTVYGPRQRPDMAIRRLVECAFTGDVFELAGDGEQIRDFTFIDDVVESNLAASRLTQFEPGSFPRVINIGGGEGTSMNRLIEMVGKLSSRRVDVRIVDRAVGDPRRTGADVSLASQYLDWRPKTGMQEGINKTLAWRNELST